MNQAKKTLAVTSVQQKAQSELATPEKAAVALTDLSMEYAALQAKATRTPEEDARLKTLEAKSSREMKRSQTSSGGRFIRNWR